jgi:hypothetical protein
MVFVTARIRQHIMVRYRQDVLPPFSRKGEIRIIRRGAKLIEVTL